MNSPLVPGDIITFQGVLGLEQGLCLVLAVEPQPSYDGTCIDRLLTLTANGRLFTREVGRAWQRGDKVWVKVNGDE